MPQQQRGVDANSDNDTPANGNNDTPAKGNNDTPAKGNDKPTRSRLLWQSIFRGGSVGR